MKILMPTIVATLVVSLSGCANPMTKEAANSIGANAGLAQKCYNEGLIDGATYERSLKATHYTVSTWGSADKETLESAYQRGMRSIATRSRCSSVYQYIAAAEQHSAKSAANQKAWDDLNRSLNEMNKDLQRNRPVNCTSMALGGGMVSTNCY